MFLLWIVLLFSQSAAQKCFVSVSTNVPRAVLSTVKVASPVSCNVTCFESAQCEACSFNALTSECTLLGPTVASNQCTSPYTSYEKRTTSDCTVQAPSFLVNDGYTPGQCSTDGDVVGPPESFTIPPCGSFSPGNRRVVLDAIMHNGSHIVFENYGTNSYVGWDSNLASWYYHLGDNDFYFKCGTCVRVPARALPGCDCLTPLPTEAPMAGYTDIGVAATMENAPVCPNNVQLWVRRATFNGVVREVVRTAGRAIYCAMGTWMNIIEDPASGLYLEYTVNAATCVG